jgi:hypothetical protein
MLDVNDYLEKLESIRGKKLLSITELANKMGISNVTLLRLFKHKDARKVQYKTLRLLRDFVEENYKEQK